MATAVQQAPMQQVPTMQQVAQPPGNDQLHTRHYNIHGSRMQQTQPLYSLCVPAHYDENNAAHHNNIFKQINIIPGFDAANSIVDTGVKLFRPNGTSQLHLPNATIVANEFDGKRMRRSIQRRTVDYNASTIQHIKHRLYKRSVLQNPISQPDVLYYPELNQPSILLDNPMNSVTTRFVRASTNKVRCPVFSVAWTPEGRRVVTGTSSGEFTLWNGLTFNFETILQAHDSSVRAMQWSHNDMWLLSGDHNGVIKYWQSNMNNVKMTKAHTDPIRGVGFCPTDNKFVTCSDDGLIKLWDFYRCQEERTLRGHGADVKCIGWHPFKSLVASGSKDSQQPLKIWDPRSGASLATIHGHKSTVMDLHWNKNGNWLLTGSRDRLLKVFDIRVMKEIYTFRGHKKEAASVNWHPLYEKMFASGGSDGAIMFWQMGCEKELAVMENAHDGMIWDLQWHPLGHILCSGSNDHTTKFWTRNRPGDKMRDKYNLNVLPPGVDDDYEYELPNGYTEESQPVEESQEDTDLYDSMVHESVTEELPSEVINSPLVKSLIAQTSMEVQKPETKETPAQIFTVSRQKSGRLKFRVDETRQKRAMDEAERILQEKEEILAKGVEFAQNAGDNSGAPSLLDLDIAPPPFLKTREWDDQMKDVPCIEDIKRQQKEEEEKKAKELAEKNKNMPPPPVTNNNNTNNWQGNYQNNYNYNNGMLYDNRMPDNYNHPPPLPYNNGQYNGPPPPQPPPQQHGGPPMHHGPLPPPQHPGPPQQQHFGPPPAHYNNPPPSHYGGPPPNNNYDGHFNGPPKNGNNYNGQNYDGAPPQKKERFDNRNRWQEVGGRR